MPARITLPTDADVWCPPIDMTAETITPIGDLAIWPGHAPTRATVYAWARYGVYDRPSGTTKRLATVRYGGRLYTSREAVLRFISGPAAPQRSKKQETLRAAAVRAELDAIGL